MILVETPLWQQLGEQSIWLAAVATALGVLSRLRPIRWLWNRLIADPMGTWLSKVTSEAVGDKIGHEFISNGGESLRDVIDKLSGGQEVLADWAGSAAERQSAIETKIDMTNATVTSFSTSVGTTLSDHGKRVTLLEAQAAQVIESIDKLHSCIEARFGDTEPIPQEGD